MKIVYLANPRSVHDCKWINYFAKDHDVRVVTQTGVENDLGILEAQCEPILGPFSLFNRSSVKETVSRLKSLIGTETDIIHSMYAMPNAIWADFVRGEIPHVATTRGSDVLVEYARDYLNPTGLSQKISYPYVRHSFAKAIKNADFVSSTSMRQRDAVVEIRGSESGTEVIRTGVDESLFEFAGAPSKRKDFFCPRSMKPIYNLELLAEAFDVFVKREGMGDSRLRLIDDNPGSEYSEKVREVVSELDCSEKVQFLGAASQTEMIKRYQAADAIIMIPKSDGTPVSGIEAMMIGRPLILGPLEYDEDLFSADKVWKAKSFAVGEIANAMSDFVSDVELEEKVDLARVAAVERAGLSASLERISNIYEEVAAKR